MSTYFAKYDDQVNKMENIMDANGLFHTFKTNSYPITMIVQPNNSPAAQMEMFDTSDDGVSSQDAKLVLQFFVGEIVVRVYGRLIISDALMGKIKNQAKKMRDLWLQADFASRMEQAGLSSQNALDTSDKSSDTKEDCFEEFLEEEEDDESQE